MPYFNDHSYNVYVEQQQRWESPRVRIVVTTRLFDALGAWKDDTDVAKLPSIADKLSMPKVRGQVARDLALSPLLKASAIRFAKPFSSWQAEVLPLMPTPSILHVTGIEPRGFDKDYPDFLPPDPRFGTTDDFVNFVKQAQEMDMIVMPYTNPTWWDPNSPTLSRLPPGVTINDAAALNRSMLPIWEAYDDFVNGGYVMSLCSPFVRQRLANLAHNMTIKANVDILFEDQIGARPFLFDFNAQCDGLQTYLSNWLNHTGSLASQGVLLGTEQGFDRAAQSELMFFGGVLSDEDSGTTNGMWGAYGEAYRPVPVATAMTRASTIFMQHDLGGPWTTQAHSVSFALSMGYSLQFDMQDWVSLPDEIKAWLPVAAQFQRLVAGPMVGLNVDDYWWGDDNVTHTSFGQGAWHVFANMNNASIPTSQTCGPTTATLPGFGVIACSDEVAGAIVEGLYNMMSLADGLHGIIEVRDESAATLELYHPYGADTSIAVNPLGSWPKTAAQLTACACAGNGTLTGCAQPTISSGLVVVDWARQSDVSPVEKYVVGSASTKPTCGA